MILSTILCCMAFFVFILQLFRLKQGERFVFTAIIQLLACKSTLSHNAVQTHKHVCRHATHPPKHAVTPAGAHRLRYRTVFELNMTDEQV